MRSLDEILTRARAELATNPTITVYDMHDGEEFNRRAANPWLPVRRSFDKIAAAAARMCESLNALGDAFKAAGQS